ncbi:MAG: GerW family sporulation protein [Huintestinicola sp.]
MDTKVKDLVTSAMGKIHEMTDANTIMGDPVTLDGGVTVIPVSKVSYGFASGGSDIPSKTDKELFGGASGAGITVTPMGFLVVSNGEVQLLQMNLDVSASSAIINMVPDVFNKVASLFKKDKPSDKKGDTSGRDTEDIEIPADMLSEDKIAAVPESEYDFTD